MEHLTDEYVQYVAELQAQHAPDRPLAPDAPVSPGPSGTPAGAPVEPLAPDAPVCLRGTAALDEVRSWLGRFVSTVQESDLDLLTLWAAHTHLCVETYTTARLLLDSPVPGSGKTTTLEHLERLCLHPVQMASVSSPAMLVRLLDSGLRTMLIDEADRSLSPDKEGIGDLIAVLNSGYKRGATRPVLVPSKADGWVTKEMSTFAPVVMAGNSPRLPEDTLSRSVRVLLMPDVDGVIEESDWEWIEDDARAVGARLAAWADSVRDDVRRNRPTLPETVRGRARERWSPMLRVAEAAGGRWPDVVRRLAVEDVEEQELAREEGVVTQRPHVLLLQHIAEVWPEGETFAPTEELIDSLVAHHPETWGEFSPFGKRLNAQRLGRMLAGNYKVHTVRPDSRGGRGYAAASLSTVLRRFGLCLPGKPAHLAQPVEPAPPEAPLPASTEDAHALSDKPAKPAQPAEPAPGVCADRSHDPHLDGAGRWTCPTCEQIAR
jgi:hypothetical protein